MAKKIMSLLVVMIMTISLLCGVAFATESTVATTLPEAVNGVITLTENVEVDSMIKIEESVRVNLNGFNITRKTLGDSPAFYVNNADVVLTIEGNGTVSAHGPAVWVNAGKAILKSGTYYSEASHAAYAQGTGHIDIENGTYSCNCSLGYVVNLYDSDRATASISVTGGTFINWDPSNNGAEGANTNFVAEGYKAVADGSNYKVVVDEEVRFRNAVAEGGTITLDNDVELTKLLIIEKSVTINLNGHSITRPTGNGTAAALYVNNADATLTIEGEGNVTANGPAVWVYAGKAILKGGTYNSKESNTIYAQGTGHIEIIDGTYKGEAFDEKGNKLYVLNLYDSDRATTSISVTGGRYLDWNPGNNGAEGAGTNFVADGLKAVLSDGYYVIVCAHKELTGYPLKQATITEEGCLPYFECNNCHKLFADAAATKETTKEELILDKLVEVKGTEAIISDAAVMGAIQNAENSSVVELPVLEASSTVKEVTVPIASVEAVAAQDKGLLIETSDVTVTLDAKTVATVAEEAKAAEKVTIEVTKEETKILNTAQKDAVKDKKVEVVISAKILADGKEISDFKGGKVTVEIPFKPAEGLTASDYKFVFIDDNGKVTEIPSKYFDGVMVVELEHFSEYAIVREEKKETTEENKTESTPAPAPAPAAPVKDNTPKTGAISVVGLVSVMAVGGLVLTRKKK